MGGGLPEYVLSVTITQVTYTLLAVGGGLPEYVLSVTITQVIHSTGSGRWST